MPQQQIQIIGKARARVENAPHHPRRGCKQSEPEPEPVYTSPSLHISTFFLHLFLLATKAMYNIATGGIANNLGNATVNNVGGIPMEAKEVQGREKVTVVMIAKDKEWSQLVEYLNLNSGKTHHLMEKEGITSICATFHNRECVFVQINGMGPALAKKQTNLVLRKLKPYRLTTLGFCGGAAEDMGKAFFFEEATTENGKEVKSTAQGAEAAWRLIKDLGISVRMKDRKAKILSVIKVVDKEDAVVEKKDAVVEEVAVVENDVNSLLTKYSAHGVDMEIAFIWAEVNAWNLLAEENEKCLLLPAIKGVSDNGDKLDRDGKFGEEALKNTATAFKALMKKAP